MATALVHRVDAVSVPGVIELQASDAPVVAGDSGGGIWHNGKPVGNLWAITEQTASGSWRQWLGGASDWQATGQILVAVQPLGGQAGLITGDLASEFHGQAGYERGPQR